MDERSHEVSHHRQGPVVRVGGVILAVFSTALSIWGLSAMLRPSIRGFTGRSQDRPKGLAFSLRTGTLKDTEMLKESRKGHTGVQDPAFAAEIAAHLLQAGQDNVGALELLAEQLEPISRGELTRAAAGLRLGLNWEESWNGARTSVRDALSSEGLSLTSLILKESMALSIYTGASAEGALRKNAQRYRKAWKRQAQWQAAQASVSLLVPSTLCLLPAFLLLGVGLLGLALISQSGGLL